MEIQWDFDTDLKTDGNLIVPVENDIKIDPKEFGLSIIPVAANKKPIIKSWSEYQSKIAPISLWHSHYIN